MLVKSLAKTPIGGDELTIVLMSQRQIETVIDGMTGPGRKVERRGQQRLMRHHGDIETLKIIDQPAGALRER